MREIMRLTSRQEMKRKMLQARVDCLSSKNFKILCGETNNFEGTFRRAIWPILMVGQIYGVMPVVGISSQSLSDLHFKSRSFRTIYSVIVAINLLGYSLFLFWKILTECANFNITNFLFYAMNTLGFMCFFMLSSHWPELMEHWQSIESLPIFRNFTHKTAYVRRIRLMSFTILLLALVEHCLFIGVTVKTNIANYGDKDVIMELIKRMVPHLIPSENPPPKYIAIAFGYLSESATFVWNFLDVFIMIIGIGLTTHFKALNNELEKAKFHIENLPIDYWIKMRIHFTKLCALVAMVDEKISLFVALSFTNNLFMICQQLFESLRPLPTFLHMVYFWYSLSFLILRTFAVSFMAASIDDESRKPLAILLSVPSHLWNEETKRFRGDILCKRVALSGMEFFYVTRQFILSITGTIVTYELVLIEFHRK